MFTRTGHVLLRQKYEAETEEIRSEYEIVKNGLVSARQETDELRLEKIQLINENRLLEQANSKLKLSIEDQNNQIAVNKVALHNLDVNAVSIADKIKDLKSKLDKLDKDKSVKLNEFQDLDMSLNNIKANISKSLLFLDKLNDKINIKKLELDSINKECVSKLQIIKEKESLLQEYEKEIEQKRLDNVQESNRLNKYKERLNKYYEEFGINIKL